MSDLVIKEPLASAIRAVAEREGRDPETEVAVRLGVDTRNPSPRPAASLSDDLIDIPDDITNPTDRAAYCDAARAFRPKLYQIAREYWARVG